MSEALRAMLHALLLPAALAALPCEYWLCEESATGPYSRLNVSSLGLQTNRTIAVNANTFGAGKTMPFANGSMSKVPLTLHDFLAFDRACLKFIKWLKSCGLGAQNF